MKARNLVSNSFMTIYKFDHSGFQLRLISSSLPPSADQSFRLDVLAKPGFPMLFGPNRLNTTGRKSRPWNSPKTTTMKKH